MPFDVPRSLICLVATVIAAAATAAVARDTSMTDYELATGVFSLEAVVLVALTLLPSRGRWSERRRGFTRVFTSASIAAGLVLVVFTGARTAGDLASGYTLPIVLGIASTAWTDIATFGVPILLAIAGSDVPDRLSSRSWPGTGLR